MNPLLQQALGSIFRWALALGVPFFVSAGIWTPEESTAYVTAGAAALVALAWSLWQKYGARAAFVKALEAPPGSSEESIAAKANPSIQRLMVVFLTVGLMGSVACAGKAAQIAVAADDAMHDGLARGHDELDTRCVVTNPNALTPPTCTALKATLADVFAAYRHVNQKIREGFRLSQLAAEIGTFKARIDAIVASIRKLVAEGGELIAGELLRSRSVFDEEGGTLHPLEE